MMRHSLIPMAALMMAGAGGAHAACVTFSATAINVKYDPLGAQSNSQIVQPVTLTAGRSSVFGLDVTAQFVDEDSNGTLRIGTSGPTYTITSNGSGPVVVGLGAGQLSQGNTFFVPGRGSQQVNGIQFLIDPGQDLPAGVFSESLDMQLRCGDSSAPVNLQSNVLQITVDVPSTLKAYLAGTSSNGTLDFGDFSNLTKQALVNIQSTGPFGLSIASDGGGVMKLSGAPAAAAGAANAQVGYTMTFNGAAVSVGSNTHFGRTGIGGLGLPLSVTAESIAGKRAGTYRDTITLTFSPLATL